MTTESLPQPASDFISSIPIYVTSRLTLRVNILNAAISPTVAQNA